MAPPPITWEDPPRPPIGVLVVEDEWTIAEEIKDRLRSMALEVRGVCASAEEAIVLCEQQRPDIVLMDICLRTEMDGIEGARIIRKRFDIPIVYLTAYAHRDLIDRALETAPYGYLLKPFNSRQVKVAIQTAVHRHRLDRELRKKNQLLEEILRAASGAVIVADTAGRTIYFNHQAEQITGVPLALALRLPLDQVLPLEAEPDSIASDPSPRQGPWVRTTLMTRDNGPVTIELASYVLDSSSEEVQGNVFTFHVVTDR
jgi:CheY-like chemotaxis protein